MEERVLISLLLDFYGPLLTDKQRLSLQLHHENDMSLGEIADELGVSRQAVHDNLQRARHILNDYESKLHLVAQYEMREQVIQELKNTLPVEVLLQVKVQQLLTQMEG
ncbi:MAG: YlxM family DNA-binding protein [Veillonella caviae]|uniref:YlxM family DNA-binding protein n=1 Tax=Veillonella caviae TaxID=248316 RepID=UPI002A81C01C|nr:YlxM family DNA-binding protein [Veillonella caviae]MDY4745541.1 YlxM family DNA-binding protein [Veillonella caviae]MDY5481963.1 YlxM family DNA-binding protein [Veillonella caviae]